MTPEKQRSGEYGSVLSLLALALGVFLLADSLTQLWQAASAFHPGNRNWRVTNLRLLFTQVTPITLGLVLVGQSIVRRAGWRAAGVLALVLAVPIVVFVAVYLFDASALMGTLNGPALGQLKRTTVQVIVSGLTLGVALLGAGLISLRTRAA